MIEWNDGLNLGVKTLDDDHKKLLKIINGISNLIDNDENQNMIEQLFIELEECAKIHFDREEAYLQDCNCKKLDGHIEQHRILSAKIPELKNKVLFSQNPVAAQEISEYLTDWLLKHIIEEDIPAINVFQKCGITIEKKQDNSVLTKLIKKTTDSFSFTKRIFLSAMIPLVGMLIFGFIILWNNYNKYDDMKKTSSITHIISNISELIHVIQIERGLSSGYLTSTQNKFKDSLERQKQIVDNTIWKFIEEMQVVQINNLATIQPHINAFKEDLLSIDNLRKRIRNKTISQVQAINSYTKIIENILDITPKVAFLNLDREISSSVATLSSIQHLKETLGLKRAYGTIIIEKKDVTLNEYLTFIQLLGTQKAFINTFEQTASQTQINTNNSLKNSAIVKQISFFQQSIKNQDFSHLDSEIWFLSMTKLIDKIKLFEDKLLHGINLLIDNQIENAIKNFLLWLIFTSVILGINVFILYTFKKSTIMQIDQLTNAMKDLATGGRALRLSPISINRDELAYMFDAYETTRQKLLKGDIYTQLYLSKKEAELKNQQKENIKLEELAFIDPLTGALNRRKFEELSTIELKRAIRYKSDLSFLMLDIDYFKAINDTYGHDAGDEVLKHFSSICLDMARNLDIFARIGGEEFIVMLPQTDKDGAFMFAERFRKKIFNSSITVEKQTIKYSVSIGVSLLDIAIDKDMKSILQRADKALYEAKRSGRNKTIASK